jgi:hypothetical protein
MLRSAIHVLLVYSKLSRKHSQDTNTPNTVSVLCSTLIRKYQTAKKLAR